MYPIKFDVTVPEQRNRVTVLLRYFMLIPHMVVFAVWGIAAFVATAGQWFIGVFTGKRNQAIFEFCVKYQAYGARVSSYGQLLHDQFPAFGPDDPTSPARYSAAYEPEANRLTVLLRYFTLLPAAVIAMFWGIAASLCAVVAWFSIVFTGKASSGMTMFITRFLRYSMAVNGYSLLMTDVYPWPAAVEAP